MCSRYSRFLRSTCIQVIAFSTLASVPAFAEFKWTPPDRSDYAEDMAPDVFIIDDNDMSSDISGSALPEYYDGLQEDSIGVEEEPSIEVEPPIEIKILEENSYQDEEESVEIRTINLSDKKNTPLPKIDTGSTLEEKPESSSSLILDPYPLKNVDDAKLTEETLLSEETLNVAEPPVVDKMHTAGIEWNDDASYEIIEGFGTDMPLALALSQIVPPEYAYSFGTDVNPGERVSWEGGQSWNKVLNDTLEPLGLGAFVHNKKVVIRVKNSDQSAAGAPVAQKKNDTAEPIEKLAEAELGEEGAKEFIASEATVQASIEKEATVKELSDKKIADYQEVSGPVILDKKPIASETSSDNAVSELVEDLMKPLDSFDATEAPETSEASLKPQIILNEQEKAEEAYAKKLEETNPFEDTAVLEGNKEPPTPAVDDVREATGIPLPFEEASDEEILAFPTETDEEVIDDKEPEISPLENMVEGLEPASHFRENPSNKIRIWQAKKNSNLQDILTEWSTKERVPLVWNTTEKYILDYDVFISGTYQNAVEILFNKGLKRAPEYALSEAPYSISVREEED